MNNPVSPHCFYLTVNQVAERYSVSTDTIWRWARDGDFPKGVKIGSSRRWRLADLLDYEQTLTTDFLGMAWFRAVAA